MLFFSETLFNLRVSCNSTFTRSTLIQMLPYTLISADSIRNVAPLRISRCKRKIVTDYRIHYFLACFEMVRPEAVLVKHDLVHDPGANEILFS